MNSPLKKLEQFKTITLDALPLKVVGMYVHGSVAMDSFNPTSSDIDILVIVNEPLTEQEKKIYLQRLMDFNKQLNIGKGLEMSVVLERYVRNFIYPTPYEFHFGYDHLEKYETGFVDGGEKGPDPDLAAHFVITKARGICLYGEPIVNIFSDILKVYYLKSVAQDSEWSFEKLSQGPDEGMGDVPPYAVLNYCRVLALINQDLVTSKQEGGQWGMENLPLQFKSLVQATLKEYAQSGSAEKVDLKLLKEFNQYAMGKIRKAIKG